MLNIIIGRFLNHNFSAFAHIFQTLQESSSSLYSQFEVFLSRKANTLSEIVSVLESKELISNEKGKFFTPKGENAIVTILNKLI